ncbi:MAG: amino acid permease [Planctomycetota bacterium]|nr:MAG: amino acid permease [Planctomycetota bacterium]
MLAHIFRLSGSVCRAPAPSAALDRLVSRLRLPARTRIAVLAGGNAVTIAKVVAFLVLVVPGLALLAGRSPGALTTSLTPFLPHGLGGVLAAMTFTFIALEGFEVIAAVSEEVKQPIRTIPRAMFLSIGGTLALYLLLLFLLLTLGGSWEELGRLGERAVAVGVERYLGSFGTWVVVVAGLLATFTALSSALLAASRVAFAMARDRALPRPLMRTSRGGIPRQALGVSLGLALLLVAVTRDVETAGATASLIFLLSFAFTNGAGLLVRVRGGAENGYRAPLYPMLPLCGIAGCLALSALQVVTAPLASAVAAGWLGLGVLIYWVMFREHAERVSARMEALDEDLVRLRGRRPPLVLVPLANPARAAALTSFAYALAPQGWGRVLGLTVVTHDPQGAVPEEFSAKLEAAQAAQRAAAHRASELGIGFEGVLTVDADFVRATRRLIRERAPEVVLFGMSRLDRPGSGGFLERVVADSPSDVVILNAPEDFSPDRVERILVPVAGAASHDPLRARVLGMLERAKPREVTLLRVVSKPEEAPAAAKQLAELAEDLGAARHLVEVGDFLPILLTHARQADLVVLGSSRRPGTPLLGSFVRTLAAEPDVCLLALARRTP